MKSLNTYTTLTYMLLSAPRAVSPRVHATSTGSTTSSPIIGIASSSPLLRPGRHSSRLGLPLWDRCARTSLARRKTSCAAANLNSGGRDMPRLVEFLLGAEVEACSTGCCACCACICIGRPFVRMIWLSVLASSGAEIGHAPPLPPLLVAACTGVAVTTALRGTLRS
jgi:hypothetical protein